MAVRSDDWTPTIVKTVASEGKGTADLAAAIADYETHLAKQNLALRRKTQNWEQRLLEMLRDALLNKAHAQLADGKISRLATEVAEHKRDPYTLIEEIVRNT